MTIVVGRRSTIAEQFAGNRQEGHVKYHCYGARDWENPDGRPQCEVIYHVEGVPETERDVGDLTDGWWCETCCRERGWLW
jgi:hypothetical protein